MKKKSIEEKHKEETHLNFLEIAPAVPLSINTSVSQEVDTDKSKIFNPGWYNPLKD